RLRAGRTLGITLRFLFCGDPLLLRRLCAGLLLSRPSAGFLLRLSTGSRCRFGTLLRPVRKEETRSTTDDRYCDHHGNGNDPAPAAIPRLLWGIRGRDLEPPLSIPVPLSAIRRRVPT